MTRHQLVSTVRDADAWLRPLPIPDGPEGRGEIFERAGCVVYPDRRLGQLIRGRPPGITAHQWSSATRTPLAFVVGDPDHHAPLFVVELHDPDRRGEGAPDKRRGDRMTDAVCAAVGLPLLRVESSACGLGSFARRLVEYVLDARAFTAGVFGADGIRGLLPDEQPGYRDIIGRLPDGRTGYVNDLGAVARAAAVDAYVSRQLADPIVRGLHVAWRDGTAEGWAWLEVRGGHCLFERGRIWQPGFSCGVDPSQLAEDLAIAAIGERLRHLAAAAPRLRDRRHLGGEFEELRRRRDEMVSEFTYDHLTFD